MATATMKSGLGMTSGVVSELTAFLTVKEGHEADLRAAAQRFNAKIDGAPREALRKIGIRNMRLVIYDEGRKLLWTTSFETDWDPYIDDALILLGIQSWTDWLQYTSEFPGTQPTNAEVKAFIQSAQAPATAFFDALGDATMPQIWKAERLAAAFQQVLDDPAAEEALTHPALAPLLELAAH
ncbi:MAG: hypothetical protein U0075_26100 [Thermomicrobiales bacterium]